MVDGERFLVAVQDLFDRQMQMCDVLEEIADSLPYRLNRARCLSASGAIGPLLREAHAAEEAELFPRIVACHLEGAALVERLRLEHVEDECFGEEVQFELQQLGCDQPVIAPETTGYMLRGFFECWRRHIRHERELLAALATPIPLN